MHMYATDTARGDMATIGRVMRLACTMLWACLLLAARPAFANGRFPASNQILFSPSDPNIIILRTTYGILPSRDNGNTWQFACEDALGLDPSATLDPSLGLTAKNALVAGVTNELHEHAAYLGLDVSPDITCSWNCIRGPLAGQAVSDVVVRPDDPHVVLAVTSTYGSDAGGASSQVFESTDDGAAWSAIGVPLDPSVLIQTIEVAKTDPSRVYLSGTRGVGPGTTASLFVSMDTGAHWTERPIPQFDATQEQFVWIAGVDPTQPDRVYVRSNAPPNTGGFSRLYLTTNAGATFQKVLEFQVPPPTLVKGGVGELLGFALSPDGSKIYAGGAIPRWKHEGGINEGVLFMATKADLTFKPVNSSISVECLATRGDELWACSDAASGFIVGVSTDDGAHFCPKMLQVASVTGLIDCSGGSAASSTTGGCGATVKGSGCKSAFATFCQNQVTPCQADSPASLNRFVGHHADDAFQQVFPAECRSPKSSGCGCSTVGRRATGGPLALWAAIAIALIRLAARS